MNREFLLALLLVALLSVAHLAAQPLPPEDRKESWITLENKGFEEWIVSDFSYDGSAADGGSEFFEFKTIKGAEFTVIAASGNYATAEELKNRFQVFYLIESRRFYKIEQNSPQEKLLLKKLKEARKGMKGERDHDPRLLDVLIESLGNRQPLRFDKKLIEEVYPEQTEQEAFEELERQLKDQQ